MRRDVLTREDRAFLAVLARKVWQPGRIGGLIGCLYTLCPFRGGRLRVIEDVTEPQLIRKILEFG